jgi:tetratricopeptide (TPR) repeat protein
VTSPARALGAAVLLACALASPARAQDARERALAKNAEAVRRFGEGDLEGALGLLREALRLLPDEAALRTNAARVLVELGDAHREGRRYSEAARDYHEAGGLVPDEPTPQVREGLVLHEALRDRDAVAVLEPVVLRWPDDPLAHDLLARALYRLGENARAIRLWERAVALDPKNEQAQAALERARREESVEGDLVVDLGAAHFSIKYDGAQDVALGRLVAQTLEAAYNDVGRLLGRYPPGEVAVVIYPGRTFSATTGAHGWVAGLYDGKIRVPAQGLSEAPASEVRRVLTHEYAHALLRAVGGPRVPAWLHEGFAQVAEGRSRSDARAGLRRAGAPALGALAQSFAGEADPGRARLLYAAACDLVHDLLSRGGAPLLADLLDRLGRGEELDAATRAIYGLGLDELDAAWRATLPP